ncbi:hypothetical protein [Zhenhengia yiwuensis]|uniref:hypothetical protein n=2 Tax=Zhenhengia TaxID=2944196 RepID=UPI00290ADB68|nr:hypothetical protein [Zhenhengia yiwuensis]MDU6360512.1 hypothetical protein [Clostridiales bacterium]MDY3367941.1 hypothetical protein [Zhenhengia yiwuensis]
MTPIDCSKLQQALCTANQLLFKPHLNRLSNCSSLASNDKLDPKCFKLIEITSFICSSSDLSSFAYTLSALHRLQTTLYYILDVSPTTITPYIGLRSLHNPCIALDLIIAGLMKLDPTLQYEYIEYTDFIDLSTLCSVSSATFTPSLPDSITCSTPLLSAFVQSMKGASYTLILIANPITLECYRQEQITLLGLHTDLFPFTDINHNIQHHKHNNCTHTTNCNHTCLDTHTLTKSNGNSCSTTVSQNTTDSFSTFFKPSDSANFTKSNNEACNNSRSETCNDNCSDTQTNQCTNSKGTTHTETCITIDINQENFRTRDEEVVRLLETITTALARYTATLYLPIFNFNTYFTSCNSATSLLAATTYMGLLTASSPANAPRFINYWDDCNNCFIPLIEQLKQLKTPSFCVEGCCNEIIPGMPITANELNPFIVPILLSSSLGN